MDKRSSSFMRSVPISSYFVEVVALASCIIGSENSNK